MNLLEGLNEQQKEAVISTEGPVMVIAGAGSGKTKVLTHRIAHIINDLGVDPFNVLAVTFTNKAALEMKKRVSNLIELDTKQMWISTFHSFGARVLRKDIHHLGYKRSFTILDTDDQLKVVKQLCKTHEYDEVEPKDLVNHISNHKNQMKVSLPDKYLPDFYIMYENYEEYLKEENLLDFDDLICKTLTLFNSNIDILNKYASQFNYVMIDEFQDTNKTQYDLVLLLASIHNNVFIVGDQDQSIYSFRGALVTNINQFKSDFSKSKLILLEQNYRSTQNILNAANKIIKLNTNRIDKNLYTQKKDGDDLVVKMLDSSYGEANYITTEINKLIRSGYDYKDIAILYRLNSLSRGYEDEFIKQRVPYIIYGGLSYFARKEVKDIIAYLRVIVNKDNFSLQRIINVPKRGIGASGENIINEKMKLDKISMYEAMDIANLTPKIHKEMVELKNTLISLESCIEDMPLEKFVKKVIKDIGYKKMLEAADEQDRLDNVMELSSVLLDASEFYEGTNKEKLEAFLLDLALKTDTDNVSDDDNKVKLMNYHQAKGLEFKVVFMTAMEYDIFPSSRCSTTFEIEEEFRICYVGITRAMEKLYFTHCGVRRLYGKDTYMQKSVFLNKLGINNVFNKPSTNIVLPSKSSYKIGDKVNHKAWGLGVVVGVNGDNLNIAFDVAIGLKTLKANHPSYSKVEC